ncbi:aspartate carbamoyltransferase catalytic subunit [candidate division NPL-UPA2 bacterium Unc8]|uniref:Aspartate carbamoyltransferase n=1 Tax=candidate division NPL-UPA2 bacterium Unc8 TaxID=1980939 RepID=A0A399FXW1_UNCN2|nr:Aspartate carbamoyltransferase [Bacillota bacterium]MBT9137857.1 Aspartate carbamoyltransferase [Bacillota bacterium]MBT9146470.1 Aspartate carbamoyltransferase [Bacillota bacterium]RII00210.1 MAG: aspartate carbamoyltransferase catalytic subunit [candidate division NPL-UPA2 bacterium Unc8]
MKQQSLPEHKSVEWKRKDILGLEELTAREIEFILETAESFREVSLRPIRKVPALRGKTIITLFFEPSTRTRMSFELAAKRLSADTANISSSTSSVVKGETLKDTARNIEAMKVDVIIIRHSMAGAPHLLAREVSPGVINAGDGAHEHPTQGLIDIFTMKEKKGKIKGLKVVIIGDIAHSRVARSNIWGLRKLGALVSVVAPPTLIPAEIERMGVRVCHSIKEAISDADVINVLRIQRERQKAGFFPSIREYHQLFGITRKSLESAPFDVLIMHPGPINRGVELDGDVADGPYSVILDQVTNGLAVRMAVLYLTSGAGEKR